MAESYTMITVKLKEQSSNLQRSMFKVFHCCVKLKVLPVDSAELAPRVQRITIYKIQENGSSDEYAAAGTATWLDGSKLIIKYDLGRDVIM